MANEEHLLNIVARGMDEVSGPFGKVASSVGGLGSVAKSVATGGLAILAAGVAAIGVGVLATGKAVLGFSQDTSNAMKQFGAQTGLAGAELDAMKESAKNVWAEGFGDNIGEVIDDMATVRLAFGETGDELEASTQRAITLSNVLGIDVVESTAVAASMMASYGITSEEAFDIMLTGSQVGLDRMGDLSDTLNEYSGDFDRLGFTAEQTLSILNAGLEEGAFNTDVIADGFREFGIRMSEGGDGVREAIEGMGLSFDDMQARVASGGAQWGDFSAEIAAGLLSIDDELARNAAGVEIYGTKWEDIGGDVFLAASMATEGIEAMTGATDDAADAMATGIGPALERLKRGAIEAISDQLTPILDSLGEWVSERAPKAIEFLEEKWSRFWPKAKDSVMEFWGDLRPRIDNVVSWLRENIPAGIAILRSVWDSFWSRASGIASGAWGIIQPVLSTVRTWMSTNIPLAVDFLRGKWNAFWPAAVGVASGFWSVVQPVLQSVSSWLREKVPLAIGWLGDRWNAFWPIAKNAVDGFWSGTLKVLTTVVSWLREKVPAAVAWLRDGWAEFWPVARDVVLSFWERIEPGLTNVRDWIREKVPLAVKFLKDKWGEFWPEASKKLSGFWTNAAKWLSELGDSLTSLYDEHVPTMRKRWRKLWDDAGDAFVGFKEDIQSAVDWVHDRFWDFRKNTLPELKRAWDILGDGLEDISDIWNDDLKPAFDELRAVLEKDKAPLDEYTKSVDAAGESLSNILAQGFIDGVTAGVQLLTILLIVGKEAVLGYERVMFAFNDTMSNIWSGIMDVVDAVATLQLELLDLVLPDWLTPGSPTPLELGLLGINDAIRQLPDIPNVFNTGGVSPLSPATEAAGAQRGGAGATVIHVENHFGTDSVRSDEDIMRIADQITRSLELRGAVVAL